jgi:hypothetical protein
MDRRFSPTLKGGKKAGIEIKGRRGNRDVTCKKKSD